MPISQYWFAGRVGLFLCSLPLRVRRQALPILLRRLASSRRPSGGFSRLDPKRAAQIVGRVSRLPVFTLPVFPKSCLRQSLALFHFLSGMGHPVEIHFGVHKDGTALGGHSWVSLGGHALGEREPAGEFRRIYSYTAAADRSAGIGELQRT